MLFYYFAIDHNLGVFDSVQICWRSTEGRAATIILASSFSRASCLPAYSRAAWD